MAWYRCGGGGIPSTLKAEMNDVLNKKFGTILQNYPPEGWPDNVNLLGPLPIKTASGAIADIRTAVINGDSYYYIKLDSNAAYFSITAEADETVVILNKGDNVTVSYEGEGAIIEAESIKLN